jgi:hypothetical protein
MTTSIEAELPPNPHRKLPYNREERAIYRLLSANGPMTTDDLIEAIDRMGWREPTTRTTPRKFVLNRLRFLKHKLDFHGHSCGLTNSGMRGNFPTTWKLMSRDRATTDRAVRAARIAQAKAHEKMDAVGRDATRAGHEPPKAPVRADGCHSSRSLENFGAPDRARGDEAHRSRAEAAWRPDRGRRHR